MATGASKRANTGGARSSGGVTSGRRARIGATRRRSSSGVMSPTAAIITLFRPMMRSLTANRSACVIAGMVSRSPLNLRFRGSSSPQSASKKASPSCAPGARARWAAPARASRRMRSTPSGSKAGSVSMVSSCSKAKSIDAVGVWKLTVDHLNPALPAMETASSCSSPRKVSAFISPAPSFSDPKASEVVPSLPGSSQREPPSKPNLSVISGLV